MPGNARAEPGVQNRALRGSRVGSHRESAVLSELRSFAAGRGHPEYFLLDKNYSPSSRVPCVDFSPWLCSKIRANDSEAVATFVWQVVQANPGMGFDEQYFRERWTTAARYAFSVPLDTYLSAGTEEGYVELRCALILLLLDDSFGSFSMTSDAAPYLATAMFPHSFKLTRVENLANSANSFIRRMKRDAAFWRDVPPFTAEEFLDVEPPSDSGVVDLRARLRDLPLGSRAHFFDLLEYSSYGEKANQQPLEHRTLYRTRQRGIDPHESAERLVKTGLVVRVEDLHGFVLTKTKEEIISILTDANVAPRKSWSKERLAQLALAQARHKILESAREVVTARIAPEFEAPALSAISCIRRMTPFYRVWMGFALNRAPQESR
jgi:hypothetical protein